MIPLADSLFPRLPSIWRRALYGGLQAGALASAGWIVFLIVQAFIVSPLKMVVSLIGGPILHLAWDYGGAWLLGIRHEKEGGNERSAEQDGERSQSPLLRWKRMALWTLGFAGVLALIERAAEYLDIFL